jgi:hypothetical protein
MSFDATREQRSRKLKALLAAAIRIGPSSLALTEQCLIILDAAEHKFAILVIVHLVPSYESVGECRTQDLCNLRLY